jgi:tetratricopeptide (TPR) repeat protein
MQEPGYAPASGQPANADEAYSFLHSATMRFMDTAHKEAFATPENLNRAAILIVNLAEIQRERGKKDEAIVLYNKALEAEEHLSALDKKDIYLRLAVMHSEAGRFAEAENWFRKALPLAASAQEREDIGIEILVQIQNAFENASTQGDFSAEAAERLRFAAQLDPATQADEVLGQKYAAVEAYVNAKAYQQAIDLLVELSANEQDVERVYAWYNKAAGIAGDADKMNDPAKALSLEKDFIAKHPASNYAFRLRMVHLKDAFDDPARANEAAEGYLQLFEDVQNRRTDSGDVAASSILNDAILAFVKSGNVTREYELRNRFITLYPNHENTIPFMEYMAKGHFDRNEMEDYNRLAKEIYRRDPSRNALYLFVAQKELDRIGTQFSQAYDNRDYQAAFGFRDEYLRVESQYKKEVSALKTKQRTPSSPQ